ncbi:MAG: hypothetical protein SGJ09_11330 [Phycisphaerae bacterium]|nr:hypothetical protein [Phycisphaerae bacterium]
MTLSEKQPRTTFVLVGHCSPDSGMLKNAVTRAVPGATVVRANDDAALERAREGRTVWLVNRVLDGDFEHDDGLALIDSQRRRFEGAEQGPVILLISNHAASQASAVALGALPGFGKRAVFAEETARILAASAAS